MIKLGIPRISFETTTSLVMRSNPVHQLIFIFQLENILRYNLNFSTSYGRSLESLFRLFFDETTLMTAEHFSITWC